MSSFLAAMAALLVAVSLNMRSLIEYITDPAHNLRFRYVLELYKFDPMIQSVVAQHGGCAVVASFKS